MNWSVTFSHSLPQEGGMCGYYAVYNALCLLNDDSKLLDQLNFDVLYEAMKEKVNHPNLAIDEVCSLVETLSGSKSEIIVPPVLLGDFKNRDVNSEFLDALSRGNVVCVLNSGGHWLAGKISLLSKQIRLVDAFESGYGCEMKRILETI